MLRKIRQITYSPASGKVQFESDQMVFQELDKGVAVIQLRGELDPNVKVVLRVKPPQGEIQDVEGKTVSYKSIAREFQVPTDSVGVFQCQIEMKYRFMTNISEIFQYTVQESLK